MRLDDIQGFAQSIAQVRQTVKDVKTSATDQVVTVVTTPLTRASDGLSNARDNLKELETEIAERQAQLLVLGPRLISGITVVAIGLTLGLLWIAFAQVALFLHAYGIFTGRDPMARWHTHEPEPQAVPATQPAA